MAKNPSFEIFSRPRKINGLFLSRQKKQKVQKINFLVFAHFVKEGTTREGASTLKRFHFICARPIWKKIGLKTGHLFYVA